MGATYPVNLSIVYNTTHDTTVYRLFICIYYIWTHTTDIGRATRNMYVIFSPRLQILELLPAFGALGDDHTLQLTYTRHDIIFLSVIIRKEITLHSLSTDSCRHVIILIYTYCIDRSSVRHIVIMIQTMFVRILDE